MLINTSLSHLNLIDSSSNCLFYTTLSFLSLFHGNMLVVTYLKVLENWTFVPPVCGYAEYLFIFYIFIHVTAESHLKFAASRPTMWQRQELICDSFAGLV